MSSTPAERAPRTLTPLPKQAGAPLQPAWRTNADSHRARAERLDPFVKGKRLLDIGCASGVSHHDWLHARLAQSAAVARGLDIDAQAVEKAVARGYDVAQGDAEAFAVSDLYDVAVAGEIIEHVSRPGDFLECVKRALVPSGKLVMTTPNAFGVSNFVYRLLGEPSVNGDHVAWYCPVTIEQLLVRHGFRIVENDFLAHTTPGRGRSAMAAGVRRLVPERMRWGTLFVVAEVARE